MTRICTFVVPFLVVSSLAAADWPQWRGPNRDGVSTEQGLLDKWPKDGPKLAWSIKTAGLGFSSFAIQGDKIYTLGSRENNEVVLALGAAKGDELWTAKMGPLFTFKGNSWGDGPRGTPTLDGNFLYALGGEGTLVCIDLSKKGAEVWRKNLIADFDGVMMTEWGYSESPLVDGDNVIITPGGKKGLLAALNKKTGALAWQSAEVTHSAPYSSMVAADINGARQYIQLSYADGTGGFVNGIAAKDGKLLWQAPISKGSATYIAPTPIVAGSLVYVTYGEGGTGGCHLFEVSGGFKVKDLYSAKDQKSVKNSLGSVVLVKDKIYGHSGTLGWFCQDFKKGKIDWNDKVNLETRSAATLAADGMLYVVTQDGEVGLVKASPTDTFEVMGQFKLPQLSAYTKTRPTSQSSKVWNTPAIANGKLYLRDCELIYCYEIAK